MHRYGRLGYPPDMDNTSRHVVASFPHYAQAQYAVDALADRRFPVEQLAIVGSNLQSVEQVTGRRGYGRAALSGLFNGAVIGALVGFVLGLFSLFQPFATAVVLTVYGLVIGGALGLLFGLFSHALSGGRRDFSSVSAVRAERYDVLADADVAADAERALADVDTTRARQS